MKDNPFYGVKDEWKDAYDATFPLPDPGVYEPLDSLAERKRITVNDLVRIGARWNPAEPSVLQFWWPEGVRYRDLLSERRWVDPDSDFREPKIVPGAKEGALVVVEGETDGARMSGPDGPGFDVLIMGGATPLPENEDHWIALAKERYDTVYVAQDPDASGRKSAKRWLAGLGNKAARWEVKDAEDWCDVEEIGKPPSVEPVPMLVWGQELHDVEWPEVSSLLQDQLLPVGGQLMLHAWKGSYKSWLTFDLMLALAVGGNWAGFETLEDALRCVIVQFEVPPAFYAERMRTLYNALPDWARKKYHNLGTFSPLSLPRWDVKSQKLREEFTQMMLENKVDVVLFDPIRQMIGRSSVYEQESQQQLEQFFRDLNAEGISVVFTHHDSKSSARTGGGSMLDATAGDVLAGGADTVVSVQLPKGFGSHEEATKRNLRFFVRNGPHVAPRGFEIDGERLIYQESPFGPDDDEVEDAPSIA